MGVFLILILILILIAPRYDFRNGERYVSRYVPRSGAGCGLGLLDLRIR